MDHFLLGLPPEEAQPMDLKALSTMTKMVEALECVLATLEISHPTMKRSSLGTR